MTDHPEQQPPIVRAQLTAFESAAPEEMQAQREHRDAAQASIRPMVYADLQNPPLVTEIDPDRPMSSVLAMSLKPYTPEQDNPNPQLAAIAYQKLVEHTFKLAWSEPHFTLEDLLPYRIKIAQRLIRQMSRMRGYLESDAQMMELSAQQWMVPSPIRKTSGLNGFLAVSDDVRMIFDRSEKHLTDKFQTPVLSDDGKIQFIPGLALMPPPVPMRFRDETTGTVLPDYDPDQDTNLVLYCRLLSVVAEEMHISAGAKWDKNLGRYGLMGLLDPKTVRLAMPSRLQMIAWETMLLDEFLDKIVEEGIRSGSTTIMEKYGFGRQEINSLLKMAKAIAKQRPESDIEEDRGLMILRLEDLIKRSKDALDLRVETVALKQMAIVQQLNTEQSATMSDFIRVIGSVSVIVVPCLAVRDGLDRIGRRERGRAIVGRRFDDVEQTLLEVGAVDDQGVGFAHLVRLLGGCLEVMRIGAHRHDRHHVDVGAGERFDDISQDVGGHDNGRAIRGSVAAGALTAGRGVVVATCGDDEGEGSDESEQHARAASHGGSPEDDVVDGNESRSLVKIRVVAGRRNSD